MIYNVTQEHIDLGVQGDSMCCPVARCLKDSHFPKALVSEMRIVLDSDIEDFVQQGLMEDAHNVIRTPDPIRRRINYYDRTGKMKPFKFELSIGDVV